MNQEQFFKFLKEIGAGILTPPHHPFKQEWEKISKEIKPHYYGTVPESLDKAFPNEDGEILAYRKDTYQAKTESPIVKAITELSRLLSSAKHSVRFDSERMKEYFEEFRFDEYNITRYFFNTVVQNRVLDPNAVLVPYPVGEGLENPNVPIDIDLQIIPSNRIIFNDPDYKLLIYKAKPVNKYQNSFLVNPILYRIITDVFWAIVFYDTEDDNAVKFKIIYDQPEDVGIIPWITLGGRSVPRYDELGNKFIVYKSDLSPAMPYLNDAAILDNQFKSVALSSCFPFKFFEGINCNTCNGLGVIYDETDINNEYGTKCKSCKGHGKTMAFSPLAGYYLNPTNNKYVDDNKSVEPIRFYSPDPSIIELTKKNADSALDKAENVLNINRSLKHAQSGTAKELDREPEYIEIGRISDDIYYKFSELLWILQAIRFLDYKSEITVVAPISFDLKTETELMAEFTESQKGKPDAIRFESYMSFTERRFASDPISKRIAEICPNYSILCLYTIDERSKLLASQQITTEMAIKATNVFSAVLELYYTQNFDIFTEDFEQIRVKLDEIIQPFIDKAKMMQLPEMEDFYVTEEEENVSE